MSSLRYSVLAIAAAVGLVGCGTSVDMPKGTSKGYSSARLTVRDPGAPAITDPVEKQVHGMIQKSLAKQFAAKGLAYGKGGSDLVVAYLVLYQEPGMTTRYNEYFGYGRSAGDITERAHERGVLDNQRPDYFRRAGIVIDVIDSKTNKLVFRNFTAGEVVKNVSDSARAARIDAAVAQALAPFFR